MILVVKVWKILKVKFKLFVIVINLGVENFFKMMVRVFVLMDFYRKYVDIFKEVILCDVN